MNARPCRGCRGALPGAAALVLLLAAACSTAPKKTEVVVETRNQAAEATQAGNSYYRQGRYDLALRFFTQALEYSTSVDNLEGVIQSSNSIGKVSMALGAFADAEKLFSRALAQAGDRLDLAALSASNLGELYMRTGDYQKALDVFDRLLAAESAKTGSGLTGAQRALLLHNRGTAYKNLGELKKAREDLSSSLAMNLAAKLVEEAAADYYVLASLDAKEGDLESAKKNAELALSLDKKVENSLGIAKDLYALGVISSRRGDTAAAYDYLRRSYLVSATLSMRADMRRALVELIAAAEALGRTEEAADYRKTLMELGPSS